MKGRTNSSVGGGFSTNSALLHVIAPYGSLVSITNGNITKTQDFTKSHRNDADQDKADYYFSISSSGYGTWTVTITLGTKTKSDTIVVNSLAEYSISLAFDFYFVDDGLQQSGITIKKLTTNSASGSDTASVTFTQNSDNFDVFVKFGWGFYVEKDVVDLTSYNTLKFDTSLDLPSSQWAIFGLSSDTKFHGQTPTNYAVYNKFTSDYSRTTKSIDVSNLTGEYYLKFETWGGSSGTRFKLYNVYLEG